MTTPALITGVDVSTKLVAVVIVDAAADDFPLVHRGEYPLAKLPKESPNKATRCRDSALDEAAYLIEWSGCTSVYVEQPFGASIKGVAEVERVVGAFLRALPRGISSCLLGPSEWKRIAGIGGNANKERIREEAERHYPTLRGRVQDICDAAIIARAGALESWGVA